MTVWTLTGKTADASSSEAGRSDVLSSETRNQSTLSLPDSLNINKETMDSILNMAIRAEYNVVTDLVRGNDAGPLSPVRDRPLNDMESAKLHELVVANKALLAPLIEDGPVNLKVYLVQNNK